MTVTTIRRRNRNIILIGFILIGLAVFACLLLPTALAVDSGKTLGEYFTSLFTGASEMAVSMADVAETILLNNVYWTEGVIASELVDYFVIVAGSLFIIYVFITVFEHAAVDGVSFDFFLATFVKIAITMMILLNMKELLNYFQILCNTLIKLAKDAMTGVADYSHEEAAERWMYYFQQYLKAPGARNLYAELILEPSKATAAIGMANIIGNIIKFFMRLALRIGAYTLLIELTLRKIFMPIAMLNFMQEGSGNPAIRYLKKFFGCYVRVAVYVLAYGIADVIAVIYLDAAVTEGLANMHWDLGEYFMMSALLVFAANGVAKQGGSLADDVFG